MIPRSRKFSLDIYLFSLQCNHFNKAVASQRYKNILLELLVCLLFILFYCSPCFSFSSSLSAHSYFAGELIFPVAQRVIMKPLQGVSLAHWFCNRPPKWALWVEIAKTTVFSQCFSEKAWAFRSPASSLDTKTYVPGLHAVHSASIFVLTLAFLGILMLRRRLLPLHCSWAQQSHPLGRLFGITSQATQYHVVCAINFGTHASWSCKK